MDFFSEQDKAKTKTVFLIFLFIFAIIGLATGFWVILGLTYKVWELKSYLFILLGTSVFIFLCSLVKILSLSKGGGKAVARELRCQQVLSNTKSIEEKRLLNVVEEMSIAAGIPVPQVFIMNEEGINAFAAGTNFENAVVAVSRSALEQLNREELQGVVGPRNQPYS